MKRSLALATVAMWCWSCGIGPVGAWKPAAPPPQLINNAMAIVNLPGERVGLFGGVVLSTGQPIAQTLIYDSPSNQWKLGSPIPQSRFAESTAVLSDGEVLFAGGFGTNPQGSPPTLATSYLYDATSDSWRRVGDLNTPRAGAESVVLSDGKVLIVGGSSDTTSELFDPASGKWSRIGSTIEQRTGEILAALPAGRALAAGGCSGTGVFGQTPTSIRSAEIFDESDGQWHPTGAMPDGRCTATGIPLADGRVLALGGYATFGTSLEQALIFDPKSAAWSTAGRIATKGSALSGEPLAAAVLSDHRVFVPMAETASGSGPGSRLTTLVVGGQLFDPASGSWSYATSTDALTSARFGLPQVQGTATLGEKVLVLLENNALVFDPAASPPQGAVLDSTSLTTFLLVVIGALVVAIGVVYVVARLRLGPRAA